MFEKSQSYPEPQLPLLLNVDIWYEKLQMTYDMT